MNEVEVKLHDAESRLFHAEADLKSVLARRGDKLADTFGYRGTDGLDAIHRYLIEKHHWLPHDVRALSIDDLTMLTAEAGEDSES